MNKLLTLVILSSLIFLSSARFGLFGNGGEAFELLKLKTEAVVEGPYAEIQYIQTYKNPFDRPLETQFYFPRTETSVFHKFEARFRGQTIVGRVMKKESAKKMYDWNVEQGNTVAYSERSEIAPDVMDIKVGNIPPYETVEIRFSVIEPLELIINKFFGLKLPAVLTERYAPSSVNIAKTPKIENVGSQGSYYKEWEIEVTLKSSSPFSFVSNPSHHFTPELSDKASGTTGRIYRAVWKVTIVPNKDFVVYFSPEKMEDLGVIYATHPQYENDHVLLVNFIPPLNNVDRKTAQNFLEKEEDGPSRVRELALQEDIQNARGEFIFVIDRSGSMHGARIDNLRRALVNFFLILPKDSYFNIVSFGNSDSMYKSHSVKNSPDALGEVIAWVHNIGADMGGTEILNPLRRVVENIPVRSGYPRTVIVLTDGDVFNPDEVIKYVGSHSHKMKFCSVGIGNGASEYLVKNIAKAGRCKSEFVLDGQEIGEKAIHLVKAGISQYLRDIVFNLKCFDKNENQVHSESDQVEMLMKDEPFKKWVFLRNIPKLNNCLITLSYQSSLNDETVIKKFRITGFEIAEVTETWHQIAYDTRIKELEQQVKFTYNTEDTKDMIIDLSTRYNILSSYTSFIAVAHEGNDQVKQDPVQIRIPSLDSADYDVKRPVRENPDHQIYNSERAHKKIVHKEPVEWSFEAAEEKESMIGKAVTGLVGTVTSGVAGTMNAVVGVTETVGAVVSLPFKILDSVTRIKFSSASTIAVNIVWIVCLVLTLLFL